MNALLGIGGGLPPITEGFMAQSGYKNGLKKTPKGFWAFKIRVGRKTKTGIQGGWVKA